MYKELKNIEIGDSVFCTGDSNFCDSSTETVVNTTTKYDENNGEPYKIIWLDGERGFDSRSGYAINPPTAYYIESLTYIK
jgi:hypothetical protein